MALTKNRAQMITLILKRLGVLGAGQSERAEDSSLVGDILDSGHAELRAKDVIDFPTSAVPDWAWVALRDYIAKDLVGDFGVKGQRLVEIKNAGKTARSRLDALTEGEQAAPVETDYY